MPLCSFASNVTQSTFCQCKDDVRLETLHSCFQCLIGRQRPDQVLIIRDPRCQSRTKPGFSEAMNKIWQSQLRMHKKAVGKIRVASDVQLEWISLYQMPVHHDAHTAIVFGRHNAY